MSDGVPGVSLHTFVNTFDMSLLFTPILLLTYFLGHCAGVEGYVPVPSREVTASELMIAVCQSDRLRPHAYV